MAQPLSYYLRNYVANPERFKATHVHPVLVWSIGHDAPRELGDDTYAVTATGGMQRRPRLGVPIVYELKKDPKKQNPMAGSITIGRMLTNDLVVDDPSLSRFHGYFTHDERRGSWSFVDGDSKHGSVVDGLRVKAGKPHLLKPDAEVRFGEVGMRFYLPEGLISYIMAIAQLDLVPLGTKR